MSEWRPMETAPQDGTPILVRLESPAINDLDEWLGAPPRLVTIARGPGGRELGWMAVDSWKWKDEDRDGGIFEHFDAGTVHPTGWMPLPEP